MKNSAKTTKVNLRSAVASVVLLGLSVTSTVAANGNWTNLTATASVWSAATNWSSNPTIPGTAAGDVVGLTADLGAACTVTIDTTSRTVGTLNLGDPTTAFFGYTLASSGGANLTLDRSGSGAQIVQTTAGGAADTISTPLSLNDNLTVNNVNSLTLSGIISNSPTLSSVTLTKTGAGMLTINGSNTFVASSITINGGTLYMPKTAAGSGINGALGNVSGGGVMVNINAGAVLSSGNNNWFGGNTLADSAMPIMNITGGTMAITNNYTSIGALNLTNGATVTSTGSGSGSYYGFQLRGNVTVGGTSLSTMSGSRDYHLNTTTVFDVENVAGAPAGLVVSGNMRNQSGDFANAIGGLTKTGPGTMIISGGGNTYSGVTTISAGTLQVGDGTANNGSIVGYIDDEAALVFANPGALTYTNYIVGAGNVVKTAAGTLTLLAGSFYSGSTTISNGVLNYTGPQSISGAMTVNDGKTLAVTASADTTYLSPSSLTLGNSTGANLQFGLFGTTTAVLNPNTVTINGTATVNISSCPFVNGVSYPLLNNYASGTLALGTQPVGISGKLTVTGSTVSYLVTNLAIQVWTAAVNTNWDAATTANWTNSLGGNLFTNGFPVRFDDSAAGANPLLVNVTPSAVTPNFVLVSNTVKSYIIGGLAIGGGASGLTKDGNNTLTLTGSNIFTGPIAILAGQVVIGGAGQLGGGNYAGTITDNGALNYNSVSNQILSGAISGTGVLVNNGTGTLTLNNFASGYSGGTTNNAGTLTMGASSTPTAAGSSVTGGPIGAGTLTLNGGTFNNNGGFTLANNLYVTGSNNVQAVNGNNFTLNGSIAGNGIIHQTVNGNTSQIGLGADNSGFTGTWIQDAGNTSLRFDSPNSGSASAAWVFNQSQNSQRVRFNFGTGTINLGSISGGSGNVGMANISSGAVIATLSVGALNTNTTYSGGIEANGANGIIALTKVGTGSLTLTAANAYGGLTTVENGTLVAGNNAPSGATGAFGNSAAAIALGDNNSLGNNYAPSLLIGGAFTVGRAITVGSATGANSSVYTLGSALDTNSIFSGNISLNQSLVVTQAVNTAANALTISGVIGTLNGTTPTVTFAGPGRIKLTVANTYSGNTIISGGKLILSGSGNIGSSAKISVATGATYDVSGVTASPYTLGGSQTLLGTGTVTGAVATASSGSSISPATNGVAGTLTFTNNLNLSSGATLYFDISTGHLSGNDQIVVGGTLTIGNTDTIHINALSGPASLDTTADYVLFNVAGTTTMAAQPNLLFDGTAPANASHYSIQKSGNNVVLHYSASAAPTVTSVIVTNTVDGSATAARYQSVTVYATVSPGAGTITNVSANLTSIGGSAAQAMNNLGGNHYSCTTTVGTGAAVGGDIITVTATDTQPLSGANSATLTVTATTVTWDGLAANNAWGNGTNWVGNNPPGFSGDSIIFTGGTQTTVDMNASYAVAGLTFDGSASNFTITNVNNTLTLNGGVTNSSGNSQTLNVPITLGGIEDLSDAGAGITLGGAIAGGGGLTVDSGAVTLSGSNSYAGDTTVNGTLKVGNSDAIPSGSGKGNVSLAGTLDLNGTNATINNLLGGAGTVDNTSATLPATLTMGNNNDVISLAGVVVQNSGGTNLALVKVGAGTLTIPSANTYAGGTTLSNGTLTVAASSTPASGVITSGPLGTGPLTLAGGTLNNNGGYTIANNVYVTGSNNVQAVNGNNWTLNGNITGNGIIHQTVNGITSQVGLGGDNSGFAGTWIQDAGNTSLRFDSPNAGSASAAWVFNQSQNSQRVRFNFGTGTINFGSMSGTTANGFGLANISAGAVVATVSVGALNTSTTFAGCIEANGANGSIALTKVGTGTLTLSGANTYTGLTTVGNGTLVITTAHAGNGDLVVNDGKVLGVINNGGTNTAKLNNLTLGDSAGPVTLFLTNVASNNVPVITAAGAVTRNGTCNIAISNSVVSSGKVYPLVKYGSLAGAGNFVLASVPTGVTATLTNDTSNLWIALDVTVGNNVNTNPTNLISVVTGGTLQLSWPTDHTGWRLQAQTNSLSTGLGTNWVDVPNTSTVNSYTNVINAATGSVFYRMVYP
ncbi:MAG: autotransporter-associated beta strand repeat-containing protein [Verrucomicrobiae bacterium]|nr:autotransporter-associated beta strand repeat-containing protein [Verrucomicrobiae bacterium]